MSVFIPEESTYLELTFPGVLGIHRVALRGPQDESCGRSASPGRAQAWVSVFRFLPVDYTADFEKAVAGAVPRDSHTHLPSRFTRW
jgi:hypothetical protein